MYKMVNELQSKLLERSYIGEYKCRGHSGGTRGLDYDSYKHLYDPSFHFPLSFPFDCPFLEGKYP